MICPNCRQEINENIKFCTICGEKVIISKNAKLALVSLIIGVIGILNISMLPFILEIQIDNNIIGRIFLVIYFVLTIGIPVTGLIFGIKSIKS